MITINNQQQTTIYQIRPVYGEYNLTINHNRKMNDFERQMNEEANEARRTTMVMRRGMWR